MQSKKYVDAVSPNTENVSDSGEDSEHTGMVEIKKQKAGLQDTSMGPKKLAIEPMIK